MERVKTDGPLYFFQIQLHSLLVHGVEMPGVGGDCRVKGKKKVQAKLRLPPGIVESLLGSSCKLLSCALFLKTVRG